MAIPYFREVHFKFVIPTSIAGTPQNFIGSEFYDQEYNCGHVLTANAGAGSFTLTFITARNVDETQGKISVMSTEVSPYSNVAAVNNFTLEYTGLYASFIPWVYQQENTDGFNYFLTFPFQLNNAGVAADVPASGAVFTIDIMIGLMGSA